MRSAHVARYCSAEGRWYTYTLMCAPTILQALTEVVSSEVRTKMAFCMGMTSIGLAAQVLFGVLYLTRLDWRQAAEMVHSRANADKRLSFEGKLADLHEPLIAVGD